jgi:hypothetical protein
MKSKLIGAALAAAVVFNAAAQPRGQTMEAVVTVTKVDPVKRTVWVRTPKGETPVLVPPEVNVQDLLPGTRYRVRYSEPVAVALAPGAEPSASGGATAAVEPAPGGGAQGVKAERISGVVEAIDPASRRIAVRTLDGRSVTFAVADDALVAGPIKTGDAVTVAYQQAIASRMVSTPQPELDPAPPP